MKVITQDIFVIVNVKLVDMGIYSCTAKNIAGSISVNVTLTILGIKILCTYLQVSVYRTPISPMCSSFHLSLQFVVMIIRKIVDLTVRFSHNRFISYYLS